MRTCGDSWDLLETLEVYWGLERRLETLKDLREALEELWETLEELWETLKDPKAWIKLTS